MYLGDCGPPCASILFPVLFDDWLFWQQPFCYIMAVIDNFVDTLKNNNCLMYKWLFGYLLSMSSLICSWNRTARMISLYEVYHSCLFFTYLFLRKLVWLMALLRYYFFIYIIEQSCLRWSSSRMAIKHLLWNEMLYYDASQQSFVW